MPRFSPPWTLPFYPNHLFYLLCAAFRPRVICDVGSRDGAASLRFRRVSRSSRIVAFEANPKNFAKMQLDQVLKDRNIVVVPVAISDHVGRVSFFPLEADDEGDWKGAAGSLYQRTDGIRGGQIEVDATTLDKYLLETCPMESPADVALWLDVEGAAYQVIAGADKVLRATKFIQVEVERRPFWQGQKTGTEVDQLLRSKGFLPLAQPSDAGEQVDVLYVSEEFWRSNRVKLLGLLSAAVVALRVRQIMPARMAV
jgi:FkbM family methyltransferase